MAIFDDQTRLREHTHFVLKLPRMLLPWMRRKLRIWPERSLHISDHLARDIGLAPHDIDRLRYEPPSHTQRHPML